MSKTLSEIIGLLKIEGDEENVYKNQQKKFKDMLLGLGIYDSFNALFLTNTGYAFDENGTTFVNTLFSRFNTTLGKDIRSSTKTLGKKLRSEHILLDNLFSKEILDLLDNFINCIKCSKHNNTEELIKTVESSALYQRCKMNYILHTINKQFEKTALKIGNPEDFNCINQYMWNKLLSINEEWSLICDQFEEVRDEEIYNNATLECNLIAPDPEVNAAINLLFMLSNDEFKTNSEYIANLETKNNIEQYISDCKKRTRINEIDKKLKEIQLKSDEKYFNNLLKTMDEKTAEYYKNIYYKYIKNGELENILSKDEINYHEPPQKVLNDILSDLDIN